MSRRDQDRRTNGNQDRGELTSRPFKGMLRGVRPSGPECLACKGPIDSRPGWSLPNGRGSRKLQRQGYLHTDCQLGAELETAKRQGRTKEEKDGTVRVLPGVRGEFPVYTEEELAEAVANRSGSPS